jgi:universal stress protein E
MRAIFTSVDLHLIHDCPYPLHFVAKSHNPMPRRIIAAIDLLKPDNQYPGFNDKIIYEALKLGIQCKAQVDVLYAYDLSMIDAADYSYASASMMFDSNLTPTTPTLYELETNVFNTLAERNGIPMANRHFLLGSPAKVLTHFAESQGIDVIVMGRVHHRGVGNLLGSTVERILYKMPSSVLILNPANSET